MPLSQLTVINPTTASNSDGATGTQAAGKALDGLVSEIHGKWYQGAYRGKVFVGTTLIAGVTIPVQTTTAPTFSLFNPVGSGVNLELISLDMFWLSATGTAGTILGTISSQTPTATTQGGVVFTNPINVAGQVPVAGNGQAKLYTAATVVASTSHIPLLYVQATSFALNQHVDFDGKILLAPGTVMCVNGSPVQGQASLPVIAWAEWPV